MVECYDNKADDARARFNLTEIGSDIPLRLALDYAGKYPKGRNNSGLLLLWRCMPAYEEWYDNGSSTI